eukprot:CAMPEP_0201544558 /NCGR_PEP_ID=MMETSP0173_2-20130828/1207_1 /ASSEMBLY_ACC=CAM_ASM_000268 /TAXON_ID=218659 /ORGANISM="Vexillifera sp., Strain DIVA3 564/2" /LENGTH=144 /DNA_ID=CAMNT_0047952725 /DNA_START=113 /DNA_END=544 /DNA_ORIENTATION=+
MASSCFFSLTYLALGFERTQPTADSTDTILSKSDSGTSTANSSSKAITNSTASKLSKPRSLMKWEFSFTLFGSTLSNSLTIATTRAWTSSADKPPAAAAKLLAGKTQLVLVEGANILCCEENKGVAFARRLAIDISVRKLVEEI